jgi:hypothetical protein
MRWDKKDVPQKGWTCIGMDDVGSSLESCEMCDQHNVRYVHIMTHENYPVDLRVGCHCAEHMEEDYVNPKIRDNRLRNRSSRKNTFMKKEWYKRSNGNYTLKFKDYTLTIMPSKFGNNSFGVIFRGNYTWDYNGKKITSFEQAKEIAFYLIDEMTL